MPNPVLVGARVTSGVIGAVVGVAVIAAATLLPLPSLTRPADPVTVTPVPSAQQLICPGSVLRLGDESGANATAASAIGVPATTRASTTGSFDARVLAATDAGDGEGAPTLISVSAAGATGDDSIAGAQSQLVELSDYSGFAAAECAQPSSDSWLAGGSTATGRTTLLTIANPGAVVSTVSLELFGEDGPVDAPGSTGIVVAPGSQRVLSLAGFAPELESLVVHVTSRGGPVVANLQQSVVRGIDPGGVDVIGATSAPQKQQVVPGVVILGSAQIENLLGEDGYGDLVTVLRAYVPGTGTATVSVRIVPESSDLEGASFDLSLEAGVVTDVPIEDLADGSYTVLIESDVPIVASVRASTVSAGGLSDLGWFTAADALTDSAFVAVARGPQPSLHLGNPGDTAVTVTVGDLQVPVPAGAAVSVTVAEGETFLLSGAEGLYASVGFSGSAQLASYLLGASATQVPPVVVYP